MNEICSACLTAGRKLCSLNETNYFYIYKQILEEISICSWERVRVCWECVCVLRRWARFKRDVQQAAVTLMHHDLHKQPAPPSRSRLQSHVIYCHNYYEHDDVKTECDGDVLQGDGDQCDYNFVVTAQSVKSESPTRDYEMPVTFAHELSLPHDDVAPLDDVTPHDDVTSHDDVTRYSDTIEENDMSHKRKIKKSKSKLKKHKTVKKKMRDLIAFEEDIMKIEQNDTENNIDDSNIDITESRTFPEIPVSDNTVPQLPVLEIPIIEAKFECNECGLKLKTRKSLEKHLCQHARNAVTKHKEATMDKPQCDICKKQFSSKKTYKYHMDTLHGRGGAGGGHECSLCGRRYQWRSNLARHTRTHKAVAAGELYCSLCDKSFASVATYRTHLALSSKHIADHDKPFVCAECNARFVSKTRLRDHVDWEHLHKIKFRCELCDKPFKSHTSMYIHVNNVHRNKGRKDHLCHICGKAYQNVCKLRSHVAASHGAAPAHRCPCGAAFTWHSSYYRHHRHCAAKSPSKKVNKKQPQLEGAPATF